MGHVFKTPQPKPYDMNSQDKRIFENTPVASPRQQKPFSIAHKVLIWVLLTSYFTYVVIWISPEGALKSNLLPFITPVMYGTGIAQSWSVFSPDVREANYHETALISFQDGLLKLYEFPRMQKLDYWERFRCEKYRKMFFDCMPWPDHQQFLPDFARYVAEANASDNNAPQTVALMHHNCRTPLPDPNHWVNRCDLPEHTRQTTYYFYHVHPAGQKEGAK